MITCLQSLELSLVCLKAGWAEQKACPHGQEEKWNAGLQTLPGCSSVELCRVTLLRAALLSQKTLSELLSPVFFQALLCDLPAVVCVIE